MDSLRKVYQQSQTDGFKRQVRELKNKAYGYNEMEQMVRECTANDEREPNEMLMKEIAKGTFTADFQSIMAIIWKRIQTKENEHHPYKCLVLLDFLLQEGNTDLVSKQVQINTHLVHHLKSFTLPTDTGRDLGHKVRQKATSFLQDFRGGAGAGRSPYGGDEPRSTATPMAPTVSFEQLTGARGGESAPQGFGSSDFDRDGGAEDSNWKKNVEWDEGDEPGSHRFNPSASRGGGGKFSGVKIKDAPALPSANVGAVKLSIGQPSASAPCAARARPTAQPKSPDLFGGGGFGSDPFANAADPFGSSVAPFQAAADPFGVSAAPTPPPPKPVAFGSGTLLDASPAGGNELFALASGDDLMASAKRASEAQGMNLSSVSFGDSAGFGSGFGHAGFGAAPAPAPAPAPVKEDPLAKMMNANLNLSATPAPPVVKPAAPMPMGAMKASAPSAAPACAMGGLASGMCMPPMGGMGGIGGIGGIGAPMSMGGMGAPMGLGGMGGAPRPATVGGLANTGLSAGMPGGGMPGAMGRPPMGMGGGMPGAMGGAPMGMGGAAPMGGFPMGGAPMGMGGMGGFPMGK
jgi:hypothetical protein